MMRYYKRRHITVEYEIISETAVEITSAQVDYGYRNQGLFKECLKSISQTFSEIYLECYPTLRPMYEHLGFEFIGETYDGYNEMKLTIKR